MIVDEARVAEPEHLDPRRWVALLVVLMAAFIVVLDNTVLNVAIPTIRAEFHTTLPSLLWVVTGYALTFATLLIIGGRLGDIYGHRRIFIIGAALFGVGSLVASVSTSVTQLIVGEAIIEGIGASLMLPSTLAILSTTFKGRERATAFAAWGATAGVAAAFGPVVGGFLTSNYSWRWSFRINVIIAPLAIIGALLFMRRGERTERRIPLDVLGAALIAVGHVPVGVRAQRGQHLRLVDAAEGRSRVVRARRVAGLEADLDHADRAGGGDRGSGRVLLRRARQGAARRHPLFPFAHLRIKTYRYGLLTGLVLAMGQFGLSFVLPVFLQGARLLTPLQNGWWQFPTGVFIILGAQIGGRLIRAVGTTVVVRLGLFSYVAGIVAHLPRGLARDHRVATPSRSRVLRDRHRLRRRAAHERRDVGGAGGKLRRRERREHDGPPGRRRVGCRHDRLVAQRADPEPLGDPDPRRRAAGPR